MGAGREGTNTTTCFSRGTKSQTEDARVLRTVSASELARHGTSDDAWVSYNGEVYDITSFMAAHPGGPQIVESYLGSDVGVAMTEEHRHSEAAFELLERYHVGSLEGEGRTHSKRRGRAAFLSSLINSEKPVLAQVWNLQSDYFDWVNSPELFNEPVRCFRNPLLEVLSRTPWYVVPLVWIPVSIPELYVALQALSLVAVANAWFLGMMGWGILEYIFHRFLFHGSLKRSDSRLLNMYHFLLHGFHHKYPQDSLRLVFPPVLLAALAIPVRILVLSLFPVGVGNAAMAGLFHGYVGYDLCHFALHFQNFTSNYFQDLKRYHLQHHFKDQTTGFGITSKLYDYALGTLPKVHRVA